MVKSTECWGELTSSPLHHGGRDFRLFWRRRHFSGSTFPRVNSGTCCLAGAHSSKAPRHKPGGSNHQARDVPGWVSLALPVESPSEQAAVALYWCLYHAQGFADDMVMLFKGTSPRRSSTS